MSGRTTTTRHDLGTELPARPLVVQGSPSSRRLLTGLLTEVGVAGDAVAAVGTLAEARLALTEGDRDCVLLDLSLPDAAGLEGVAVMVAAAPTVPIVVVTADPDDSLVYAAMAEGADEFLTTDGLDRGQLREVLRRAVQRRHGRERTHLHRESAASALSSIDAAAVAIDGSGRILAANDAWTAAAERAGSPQAGCVGVSYLTVCDRAVGAFADGSDEAAAGIRSVLCGVVDHFAMDYPCPSGGVERWFSLRVTPLGEVGGGAVLTHPEITDLKQSEHRMRGDDARLRTTRDGSAPLFALLDEQGVVLHASESTTQMLGLAADQVGTLAASRIHSDDREAALGVLAHVVATTDGRANVVLRMLDGSGRWRELDVTAVNRLDDPRVGAVVVTGSDVTESRQAQIAQRLESRLLHQLPAGVVVTDERGIVTYWNDAATRLYGYTAEEAVGREIVKLNVGPADVEEAERIMAAVVEHGRWDGVYVARRSDGTAIDVQVTLDRVVDAEIGFRGLVGASIDISERRALEDRLAFQALHDPLTGLPNRRLFIEHVEKVLARTERTGRSTGLLFFDLDDFGAINTQIGHSRADALIGEIGERFSSGLRSGDIVARLGGDEFVVCCTDLTCPDEARVVAERLRVLLDAPFQVHLGPVSITASVGVATTESNLGAELLLRYADAAMYAAKEHGKARVEVFDHAMHKELRERQAMATDLASALSTGAVRTVFQPVVELRSGALVGFEALSRWSDAERGPVSPMVFIPVAERSGLIDRLGRKVLRDACEALAGWLAAVPERPLSVSVNVSALQLADPGFASTVEDVLRETGVPPRLVVLEVTESALAEDAGVFATLECLRAVGVRLAIDDFGTGYSSMSRLGEFPLDHLKIDRSFVARLGERVEVTGVVAGIIGLAHTLGLSVVAEGIETTAQLDTLAAMGCDLGQGWLWAKALEAEAADRLVSTSGPFDDLRARSHARA